MKNENCATQEQSAPRLAGLRGRGYSSPKMPETASEPPPPLPLESARAEVLDWLREPHRNPMFLMGQPALELQGEDAHIIDRFMSWVTPEGFAAAVVEIHPQGA